ncbi:MAG: S9 family peptidase [Pseudomonadota bacterium]
MNDRIPLYIPLAVLLVACSSEDTPPPTETAAAVGETAMTTAAGLPTPPDAPARPHEFAEHGNLRTDPYHWLRDDTRSDPEVISYLEAENAYLDDVLEPATALRETLFEEMVGRLAKDESTVPVKKGDFWYLERYEEGQEYEFVVRRSGGPDGPEEVLIDGNERAEGHDYYNLGTYQMSDDHRLMAIAEDTVSRRLYTIRIKDLETGEFLPDVIENTSGSIAWSADGQTLFYVERDPETLLPYLVKRHRLGTDVADDVVVHEETDPTFFTFLYRGLSGDYIYLYHGQTLTTEVQLIPADEPESAPIAFLERERGHEYAVDDIDGRFFVLTNRDAPNGSLFETTLEARADRSTWEEVLAHRNNASILDVTAFRDFLAIEERVEGLRRIRLLPYDGSEPTTVPFDEEASVLYLGSHGEPDITRLRYVYESQTTPDTTYDLDLETGERTLLKRQPVLGGFDPAEYASERFTVTARDGTDVPVSLVYRKPFDSDGSRPLLVYGYGSYGSSRDPSFSSALLSLLDRGFVYAVAHIRGGEELGRQWYDDGKMFNKMNTFTDFIDVTKGLVKRGYGDSERVYGYGGSAGGLLMGAVINLEPSLYDGVVAAVPFVDVVTTMLDESIPLTTGEFDEWGNPKIKAQYEYMLSYSPYDQVSAQDYPHLLVTTGLHDSQVQYWEPAKWVAKLRDQKTDDNYLLLYTDLESGHGGASGRYRRYEDVALRYAFFVWLAEQAG